MSYPSVQIFPTYIDLFSPRLIPPSPVAVCLRNALDSCFARGCNFSSTLVGSCSSSLETLRPSAFPSKRHPGPTAQRRAGRGLSSFSFTGEMSFTRRTRSSATSAEIPHISLASYSRPSKRARKDSYKVEEAATGDVTSPALPKTEESTPLGAVPPKKRRRAKGDYADLGSDPLTDRIREDLDVLFCGENPGIRTAETQLHCKAV
jgi:hypothetical protein